MGLFNKKTDTLETAIHQKPTFKMCIPETLAASDTLLSSLPKKGSMLEEQLSITSLIWLAQHKEKTGSNQGPSKVDKLLVSLYSDKLQQEIYFIADLFFEKNLETGSATYIAKALGSYSSIPKMLSANFKHKGELVAESAFLNPFAIDVEIISQSQNYEKRANFLFFWCEKRSILPDIP